MASILLADKDLIFPDKKVLVDLPKSAPFSSGTSQGSNGMLSTSSVSTFRTTGTTQTCTTCKTKGKVKIPSTTNTVTSAMDTTLSGSTFTEKDINFLLSHTMQALQLQINASASSSSLCRLHPLDAHPHTGHTAHPILERHCELHFWRQNKHNSTQASDDKRPTDQL